MQFYIILIFSSSLTRSILLFFIYKRSKKISRRHARKARFTRTVNSIVKAGGQGGETIGKVPYPQERWIRISRYARVSSVTLHRSRPISEPISHPRLRSIRFLRLPRGHRLPISLSFSLFLPLFSMEKRANVNRDSFNVNPWKAREMDLIHFRQSGTYLGTLDFGIPTAHPEKSIASRRIDGLPARDPLLAVTTIYRHPVWFLRWGTRAFPATC